MGMTGSLDMVEFDFDVDSDFAGIGGDLLAEDPILRLRVVFRSSLPKLQKRNISKTRY